MSYRKTSQFLMPAIKPEVKEGCYDIYPALNIGDDKIGRGIKSIAEAISTKDLILIDGFEGIFFEEMRESLDRILISDFDIHPEWVSTEHFLKPSDALEELLEPFLGGEDPLFGCRTTLTLSDFFALSPDDLVSRENQNTPLIIYGVGAALFSGEGFLLYSDLPKNELQFRTRSHSVRNIGADSACDPKQMYKRFYFVDWVVLNRHKKEILGRIDILADCQRPDDITWISGSGFRSSLESLVRRPFRTRPWFEPGTWGGSWIKEKINGVNTDVPNYAWSFELITPENGIILESSGLLVEFSFDFLMFHDASSILGDCADRFGTYFPIRFDFLDTVDGGNLSLQCHPRPGYMKENFGEDFTQEESYYILDTKNNAGVYLGFREDVVPERFRAELEESIRLNREVKVEEHVMLHPSHKHDLFLIPSGTIHGSGKNNLVLEISSTPYIFTFKMYDWLRPDLDGKPRTLNIQRGMDNLHFDRKGKKVTDELICKPVIAEKGGDWELYHLQTHPTQLYDVKRYHFTTSVESETRNRCLVLNLVEGTTIIIETGEGSCSRFSYAETFIIPAATGKFRIINESDKPAIVVLAYVKQ